MSDDLRQAREWRARGILVIVGLAAIAGLLWCGKPKAEARMTDEKEYVTHGSGASVLKWSEPTEFRAANQKGLVFSVSFATGEVTLGPGATMSEASRAFWEYIGTHPPCPRKHVDEDGGR